MDKYEVGEIWLAKLSKVSLPDIVYEVNKTDRDSIYYTNLTTGKEYVFTPSSTFDAESERLSSAEDADNFKQNNPEYFL